MVQKTHPGGVILVPSNRPQIGHLSEKNDDLAVHYEDVHELSKELGLAEIQVFTRIMAIRSSEGLLAK